MDQIRAFFEGLKGKKVALIGFGVSHRELTKLLAKKGAQVYLCDKKERSAFSDDLSEYERLGVHLQFGEHYADNIAEMDMVFRTPGLPMTSPVLKRAAEAGVHITSEMEEFLRLCPCDTIGITGSDGKTTTTTVIKELLTAAGRKVWFGGNMGIALLYQIEQVQPTDVAVMELSSFQLISMDVSPRIGVVTNLSPNHLDVHKDLAEYYGAKKNLIAHGDEHSIAVLNRDNIVYEQFRPAVPGTLRLFSRRERVENGAYCDEKGDLILMRDGRPTVVMNKKEIRIPGEHNVENYLAAFAAVDGLVSPDIMRQVAKGFGGVEHRIEFVRELDGVRYYNDSIATSPTRMISALKAFHEPVVLIACGVNKNLDLSPVLPYLYEHCRVVVRMGDIGEKLTAAVAADSSEKKTALTFIDAEKMDDAVEKARQAARPGEVVVLSPGGTSFDHYTQYSVRGRHFKTLVNDLK